jgi:hypothetical protein
MTPPPIPPSRRALPSGPGVYGIEELRAAMSMRPSDTGSFKGPELMEMMAVQALRTKDLQSKLAEMEMRAAIAEARLDGERTERARRQAADKDAADFRFKWVGAIGVVSTILAGLLGWLLTHFGHL